MILQLGLTGPLVGEVQQLLLEQGYVVPDAELRQQVYGSGTLNAIGEFQRRHGLQIDGIVGPLTFGALRAPGLRSTLPTSPGWRFDETAARSDILPALLEACSDVGHREVPDGSNDGPLLKKYEIPVDDDGKHVAWCAYALSYWLSFADEGCPWATLGSAFKIREWAKAHDRIVSPEVDVLPGDVWLKMRTDLPDKPRGHVGLVVHVAGDELSTVEGNSGNMVAGRVRSRGDATCIVRPFP